MGAARSKSEEPTLRDLLSHLDHATAVELLRPEGAALIRAGGRFEIDPSVDVDLSADRLRVAVEDAEVSITRSNVARKRLAIRCSACAAPCVHLGAALSLVLEEKLLLGLAAPPTERVPVESLSERELVARALEDREERSRADKMTLRSTDAHGPWTDYVVTSAGTGKTYKVALRGTERGVSYCSCPDFRKNTLGTCKHILYALRRVQAKFPAAALRAPYRRRDISLHLSYGADAVLRLAIPDELDPRHERIVRPLVGKPITDVQDLVRRMRRLDAAGCEIRVYPDAEEYIQQSLFAEHIARCVKEIRSDPSRHPLRRSLLDTELLPYQLDGIAFAAAAGRAILADDMGLGKTVQGIGVAELLAREAGIRRVLIVCPTSLKSQWKGEIERFCRRTCQLVLGKAAERAAQYDGGAFFTVCNYEQVLRDILAIEQVKWDLIVLDEGQRIKNWEAKTSRIVKGLRSRFALVLTGTPLENRLDDLYSIIEFIDDRRLGPAFRFMNRHRVVDDRGRVLGYKNLTELRRRLAPVLLRRTRKSVLRQLPPRTTELRRVPPTDEQLEIHGAHMRIVSSIVHKTYISEMDLLRLRKALMMCRLAANSTFLVDKRAPGYSSKLDEIDQLIAQIGAERDRKVVLFSEWTTMLDLIEPLLERRGLGFVRLDGSVPQKKRAALVSRFDNEGGCPFFLTTNAGSTGLNLQVANTVVNVDLPWNPAVLEQRISRAHRMGQRRPVQVFLFVTEETIEENLLATLSAKRELALAALETDSDVDAVQLESGMEELRRRLEVLLGKKPAAPVDESQKAQVQQEVDRLARKERIAASAGQMLTAAFGMIGELLPEPPDGETARRMADEIEARLCECIETDSRGRSVLTVTLGDGTGQAADRVGQLARSLARVIAPMLSA